jgi:methyl-accepting chemotaxis protein
MESSATQQASLARLVSEQEYRSRSTFVKVSFVLGILMAGLIAVADPAGAVRWFGSGLQPGPGSDGVVVNIGLLAVVGIMQFIVTYRMRKLQELLEGATTQEETLRHLDQALSRLQEAGGQIAGAGAGLEEGTRSATHQVEATLRPSLKTLHTAQEQLRQVFRSTVASMRSLGEATAQVTGAMTDQAEKVTESARIAAETAAHTVRLAEQSAAVAQSAGWSRRSRTSPARRTCWP